MEITTEILRKVQLIELKILVEIKRICDKHKIEFILISGSLLGAVRHKGFIPWDDDIDICMTRNNFDKFCAIASSELSGDFFLQTPFTDVNCPYYCFARVRLRGTKYITEIEPEGMEHNGFRVDVFCYDNIPNFYWLGYFYWGLFVVFTHVYSSRKKYRCLTIKKSVRLIKYLGFILCLPVSNRKLKSILENYHKKYEKFNSKYVIQLRGAWGFKKERRLRSNISKMIYVPFEDTIMPVPEDYHIILSEIYGDYMTPPPLEKRNLRQHAIEIDFGIYK